MSVRRVGWGRQKPPVGAPLNLNHSSLLGMRWALAFNESGGTVLYNPLVQATGTLSNPTLATGATWGGRGGIALDGGTTAFAELTGDYAAFETDLTIILEVWHDGSTGLRTFLGGNKSDGTERAISMYLDSGLLSVWVGNSSSVSSQPINGTATIASNRLYRIAVTRSNNAGTYTYTTYLDGNQDDTGTTTTVPYGGTGTEQVRIGCAGLFTSASLSGGVNWFYMWQRVLGVNEIQQISARPFDLYQPRRVIVPYVEQAGGGGGRTTRNTRAFPLGTEIGMGWVMPTQV